MPTSTGKSIGNYTICEQIGAGGSGSIWTAVDVSLGRTVAIKMLRPELAGQEGSLERLRSEARTLARLNHPNIATVFNLLEEGGELYLVMELVEGETLADRLRRLGRLDLRACFALYHQALDGMHYAHEAGVVHRDLKPANLMIDTRELLKLLDFGIARVDGTQRLTRTGLLVGTPEYMAPEQVKGGEGSVASDIYALGILLYEMLVGHPPFTDDAEYEVLRQQVESPPPPPRSLGADCSEMLEAVLLRALEKKAEERFADVRSFRAALIAAGAPAPEAWDSKSGPPAASLGSRERPIASPEQEELPQTQVLSVPREIDLPEAPESPPTGTRELPMTRVLQVPPETRVPAAVQETQARRRWPLMTALLLALAAAAGLNWLDFRPGAVQPQAETIATEEPAPALAEAIATEEPAPALAEATTEFEQASDSEPPARRRPRAQPSSAKTRQAAHGRWEVRRR